MKNNKIKLAICGLGRFVSRRIIPVLDRCDNIELTAIVSKSIQPEIRTDLIQRYNNLSDLLVRNRVEAVYIASPNYFHAEQSISCLNYGVHVLCEKPMATNYKDCQEMLRVAEETNSHLQSGHMLRFSAALILARAWLNDGLLGELYKFDMVFHYDLPKENRAWVEDKRLSGGGVLLDAGIHCIDVMRFFLGDKIATRSLNLDNIDIKKVVERQAVIEVICGEVPVTINLSSKSSYKSILEIAGAQGVLLIENFAATWGVVKVLIFNPEKTKILRETVVDVSDTYLSQLNMFANNCRNFTPKALDYSAAENVRVVEELYSLSITQ